MKIYFNLTDGYLDGWSSSPDGNEHHAKVESDHEVLSNPEIFKFEDGKLIKDEERQKELREENEKYKSKLSDKQKTETALADLAKKISELE